MIYVFHGRGREEAREAARVFIDELSEKNGDMPAERVYPEELNPEKLSELVLSRGLFGKPRIIVMDGVLEDPTAGEAVLKEIGKITDSPDTFIFLDGELGKETLKRLEDSAGKIFHFKAAPIPTEKGKFNIWSITDALGRRDRKTAWIYYQKAILSGIEPENIHGILVWQVKNILMAKKWDSEGAQKFGMKPFVWGKSKSFSKNFKDEEIMKLSSRLTDVYHQTRTGAVSFDEALEKLILSL